MLQAISASSNSHSYNYSSYNFPLASKGNSVADEYISKVQLGTINNSSGRKCYSDFTSLSTNLTKGVFKYHYYHTYMDWNKVQWRLCRMDWLQSKWCFWRCWRISYSKTASQTTPCIRIVYSPYSANGSTQMRVSMKYNAVPTACEAFLMVKLKITL
jgi:hypothetical protein